MYIVQTAIIITQVPNPAYPNRTFVLNFNFVTEFNASDGWRDLTNKAKIIIPKNIYYIDGNGRRINLGNNNANIGGFDSDVPIFLRGDRVTIRSGYKYNNGSRDILDQAEMFSGFITEVGAKMPIVLSCEDNMYKLKQIPAPNKLFPAKTYTLESILRELLAGTEFTVNALTQTSIGDFRTQNETVCDVLARIRKDYHFESYFRGNELRCGSIVYIEEEAKTQKFIFQENIIEDDLVYRRKDDVVLSAVAYSVNKTSFEKTTKDGHTKSKKERLEVTVTFQNGVFTSKKKELGQKAEFPPNYTGERRTLYFWDVKDANKLIELAKAELTKYYYTGLKGKFTTFGIPFVRQGDNADISDRILPERSGVYKIKSVEYSLSVDGGLRQEIELDYRIR